MSSSVPSRSHKHVTTSPLCCATPKFVLPSCDVRRIKLHSTNTAVSPPSIAFHCSAFSAIVGSFNLLHFARVTCDDLFLCSTQCSPVLNLGPSASRKILPEKCTRPVTSFAILRPPSLAPLGHLSLWKR